MTTWHDEDVAFEKRDSFYGGLMLGWVIGVAGTVVGVFLATNLF